MDVHVRRAITEGLRRRGVDVMTAQEDGTAHSDDPALLDRARIMGRALFSQDADMLAEATRRQEQNESFSGVIYAHQLGITTGQAVLDLELISKIYELADLENRVNTCRCDWSGRLD
jgi:hypothetical protein